MATHAKDVTVFVGNEHVFGKHVDRKLKGILGEKPTKAIKSLRV